MNLIWLELVGGFPSLGPVLPYSQSELQSAGRGRVHECGSCRYQGPLLDEGTLDRAVCGGAVSPEFTKVCAWIVSELRLYCRLEENVHATNCETIDL